MGNGKSVRLINAGRTWNSNKQNSCSIKTPQYRGAFS